MRYKPPPPFRLVETAVFVSLLTDPTTGGVSASFATLGCDHAEPGAMIGFAPRVIEQITKQKLPAGFNRRVPSGTWNDRHGVHRREPKAAIVKSYVLHGDCVYAC